MKKSILFIIILMVFLTACSGSEKSIYFDEKEFEFISEDKNTYAKTYKEINTEGESSDLYIERTDTWNKLKIKYKDQTYYVSGSIENYTVRYPGNIKASVQSDTYGSSLSATGRYDQYPDPSDFVAFINRKKISGDFGQVFLGFFLIVIGGLNIAVPELSFYLSKGWQFKDAEPSDLYLSMTKFSGVVACIIGVIVMFTGCFA